MTTPEDAVTDARKVLRSIVDRWDRQRYSSPLKDQCAEILDLIDKGGPAPGADAGWEAIVAQGQRLREVVTAAGADGYGGSLLAAARSLLEAIEIAAAGPGGAPRPG